MKTVRFITAILLTLSLLLTGAAALAEEADFSEITGVWYTEEIMMEITEDGRFEIGWNDEDWLGSLQAEPRTNDEGEEYTAYRMTLDNPELSMWDALELVTEPYHSGKLTLVHDGTPGDIFYDIPVSVTDLGDEDPSNYDPYVLIDEAAGQEPAVTLMFTLLRPATDVAVMHMYDQEIDEEGYLGYNATTLEWWAELDSQTRIVVKHVFEGDLPDLCFSFLAEDGTRYDFAVQISGMDGELELLPLLPSNG